MFKITGPEFEDHFNDGFEPISRNDGAYVQIIHTNVGQLGMQHRVGTIDFYPDGGLFYKHYLNISSNRY